MAGPWQILRCAWQLAYYTHHAPPAFLQPASQAAEEAAQTPSRQDDDEHPASPTCNSGHSKRSELPKPFPFYETPCAGIAALQANTRPAWAWKSFSSRPMQAANSPAIIVRRAPASRVFACSTTRTWGCRAQSFSYGHLPQAILKGPSSHERTSQGRQTHPQGQLLYISHCILQTPGSLQKRNCLKRSASNGSCSMLMATAGSAQSLKPVETDCCLATPKSPTGSHATAASSSD